MDLNFERIRPDMKALDHMEAKMASDLFLAKLFGMKWLVPLHRSKHAGAKRRKANWRAKRNKKRRIAAYSRARNRRK